jgi:hypothetical protein
MSRLNIQNDLFLGYQELQRQSKFIKEDGYLRIFKSLINNFGIVNVDIDSSFDNFKVQGGTNTGTVKIDSDSYAIDEDLNIIFQRAIDNVGITDDNSWYWLMVSYEETSIEVGTVNLAVNGSLTGINTKFTEVLRDQSNYPVKINFPGSAINTGDYFVVSVLSDTQAVIAGSTGFTGENGLEYKVVGSYTPGISLSGTDRIPYFYDSCNMELIPEVSTDTPPAKTDGVEFYIARVKNNGGSLTIQDKRTEILSVPKKDTGWVQPILGSNFTNVSSRNVRYRLNDVGEVEIEGAFTTTVGTDTLFTLPVGFRPPFTIQGIYGYSDGSVIRLMTVDSGGVVKASTSFAFHTSNQNVIITMRFKTV